jgi:oxaloacetate decarboxylase alpha subunit
MSNTAFVDVSLTDGQSAAWGGALATPMALEPMGSLANAGMVAIEALSPTVIAQCLARGENPLQRLSALRERAGATPLRVSVNLLPDHGRCDVLRGDALKAWLAILARLGASEALIIDPLLDSERLEEALGLSRAAGLTAIAALPYLGDADHDDAYYASRAAQLAAMGAERVMLRDEAGLLHADRVASLIPALAAALGEVPLDLHTRCQTGLGPQVVLEAARLGVHRIDTALPCVANGASVPSLPLLVHSAALIGVKVVAPDAARVADAQARLAAVADQEGFSQSLPWAFDLAPYIHQLPGEVAAEAIHRLRGHQSDLHPFARECERIRQELGSPPMLQPFARAIAVQALAHLEGEPRYATLQPGVRRLLQGIYAGVAPGPGELRRRVGSAARPRVPHSPLGDDNALLALIGGIAPAAPPAWQPSLQYEHLTPERALARGLLQRWHSYAGLSVRGPSLSIAFEHKE